MLRTVLTVAASDPSGGAGIQADLRVFSSQGVAGVSAITAITVQDTRRVHTIVPVAPEVIEAQVDAVLSDCHCPVVKIGLLPGASAVRAVARALARHHPEHVVLDPVMASTGGFIFLDEAGQQCLREELIPLCSLVTPNLAEAAALVGKPVISYDEREAAAFSIQSMGPCAVLIKGGHLPGEPEDLLLDEQGTVHVLRSERIATPHTHGTGCFLASAIAARLALGDSLLDAASRARALLVEGLQHPVVVGQGRGSADPFAGTLLAPGDPGHAARLALLKGLYVLTDPELQGTRSVEEIALAAFAGGARILQLRHKGASTPELVRMARQLREFASSRDALIIVNDRVDVAAAAGADGVHLGPDDMRPRDARRILGWDRLVGVSVGTVDEALDAAPYASYLAVGAIFGSSTKSDAGAPVGPTRIAEIRSAVPHLPIVAIGGINRGNIDPVIAAGADSAAVISAVLTAPDLQAAVQELAIRFRP